VTFSTTARVAGKSFSPADIDGLVGWWDASTLTGLSDGNPVGTWYDITGTRDLTATGTERPVFKTGVTPSGLNAVRFDGSDDNLAATVLAQRTFSIVMAAKVTGGDAARILAYNGTAGASGAGMYATSTTYFSLRGGVSQTSHSSATPDSNWHVFAYQARDLDFDDTNMAVDNTFGAYRSANFNQPATRFTVYGEGSTNSTAGDVAAILLYDVELGANFTTLHDYLADRYL
jgi:hypothetical protein